MKIPFLFREGFFIYMLYFKINNSNQRALCVLLFGIILFELFAFPFNVKAEIEYVLANEKQESDSIRSEVKKDDEEDLSSEKNNEQVKLPEELPQLPLSAVRSVKATKYVEITAYTSDIAQCDNSPCTTATGFNVCKHGAEDTVAANFLKFGTKIKIPEYYGNKIFIVRDRMNPRYQNRIDVWMIDRNEAIKFGVRKTKIEILE